MPATRRCSRNTLLVLDVALQRSAPFIRRPWQEQERDPDEENLQQPPPQDNLEHAGDARTFIIAAVRIAVRGGGDAIEEHEETHDGADNAMGYKLRALELQYERDKLKLVRLVNDHEEEQEDKRAKAGHRDERDDCKRHPDRVTKAAPEGLVVRVDVVAKKGPNAIGAATHGLVTLVISIDEQLDLPQDLLAEIGPYAVNSVVFAARGATWHVWVLQEIL
mmetsp:Transcript_91798/g.259206  ORF Transcript_91798/g.259206 Transcript_91798/m.259206 type:complete len:220 (+) Transcript_91798:492-1151(+)